MLYFYHISSNLNRFKCKCQFFDALEFPFPVQPESDTSPIPPAEIPSLSNSAIVDGKEKSFLEFPATWKLLFVARFFAASPLNCIKDLQEVCFHNYGSTHVRFSAKRKEAIVPAPPPLSDLTGNRLRFQTWLHSSNVSISALNLRLL